MTKVLLARKDPAGHTSGGAAYENLLARALHEHFSVYDLRIGLGRGPSRYAKLLRYLYFRRAAPSGWDDSQVLVKTLYCAWIAPKGVSKSIVLVHHLGGVSNTLYRAAEPLLLKSLDSAAAVVTVSEYWRQRLALLGVRRVHTIYNAWDETMPEIAPQEVARFRDEYHLGHRPIVYLGREGYGKGVERARAALSIDGVEFIATGDRAKTVNGVRTMHLSYREYLMLLNASSVAVIMSQFDEGWCRTAHEALWYGTPVIGSGSGGMGELLRDSAQMVCSRFDSLGPAVTSLLRDSSRLARMSKSGQECARGYTFLRFSQSWSQLIRSVILE